MSAMGKSATIAAALLAASVLAETPRPMLIVAGDGAFQNLCLNMAVRAEFYYCARMLLTSENLARSGTVILTQGGRIGDVSSEDLARWVRNGGNLVVVGDIKPWIEQARPLLGPKAETVAAPPRELRPEAHPLLGRAAEDALPDESAKGLLDWRRVPFSKLLTGWTDGQPLLHAGGCAAIWLKTEGKGRVIYLAAELFPPFPLKADHWRSAVTTHDDFLRNLCAYLGAATMAQAAAASKAPPVAWYREPPPGEIEGGRTLWPPFPASPDETLSALRLLAGRNEHERRVFFTTVPFAPKTARVTVGALKGPSGEIPAAQVKAGYQGKPTPDYRGPLCFIRWLSPDDPVAEPCPVSTWWLDVHTAEAAPGTYRGEVRLDFDSAGLVLPVEVEVDAAAIPARRPFHFSAEYYVYNLAAVWNEQWPMHWEELGIDFFVGGYLGHSKMDPIVRATGEPLTGYAAKAAEPVGDHLPPLDFSRSGVQRWDLVFQQCLARRLTNYRTYHAGGASFRQFVPLAEALYRKKDLSEDSPEARSTAAAVLREYGRFLREKGYRNYYSKVMDEWPAMYLDNYLAYATLLHASGWGNVANPDVISVLSNRVARDRLWPVVDLYWIEGRPAFWYDLERIASLGPNDKGMTRGLMSFYTGSFWWDRGYLDGPRKGWASGWRRRAGFHLHGWSLRGKYGEENVYHLPGGGVCPAMNLVMMAEGMDDAQYGIVFQDMLHALRANPATRAKAEDLGRRYQALVGDSPDAALPVADEEVKKDNLRREDFIAAKRALFRLIGEAREETRKIAATPNLRWGQFVIADEGKPAARVLYDAASRPAAETFAAQVRRETGVMLPVAALLDGTTPEESVVFLSNRTAEFDAWARTLNGAVNRRYPDDGAYVIHSGDKGNLWIVGGDAAALTLGGLNLLRASDLSPVWFEPTTAAGGAR